MTCQNQRTESACRLCFTLLVALLGGCGGGSGGSTPDAGGPTNHFPTLTGALTASPNLVVGGQVVQLSVSASDSDGDTLTYTWSAPGGTLAAQGASTTWTAPAVSAGASFQLSVTVSDGRGGSVGGTAAVYVTSAAVPSFAADLEPIFNRFSAPPGCTICHVGGNHSPRLEPSYAWAAIVGVSATDSCTSQKLVNPGDPDSSVLFQRIAGEACGTRMPPGLPEYFDTHPGELAAIRSWILAGAPNN